MVAARPSSTIRNLFCLQTCCCILLSYVVSKKVGAELLIKKKFGEFFHPQESDRFSLSSTMRIKNCRKYFFFFFSFWRRCIFIPRSTNPSKAPKKGSPTKKHLWPPSVIAFYKKRNMKRIFGVDLYSLGCWIRRLGLSFIVSRQKDQRGARLTLCTRRWIICAEDSPRIWTLHCMCRIVKQE